MNMTDEEYGIILPKLWLQRIQRYWDLKIPDDYPKNTAAEFSLTFENETIAKAVKTMEDNLNTKKSIITEDMIPETKRLGDYIGTYNVTGEPNELTLLSPEKVSDSVVDILAFHYNGKKWERIEDAHIENNYVYGTLSSFSPISLFTIKRDTVYNEMDPVIGTPTYIANGISIIVGTNDNNETVVTDANGKETVVSSDCVIVGGTLDGTDIDSVSIYAKGAKFKSIIAGSKSPDNIVNVNKISLTIIDCEIASVITLGSYNCRVNDAKVKIENTKSQAFGVGESWCNKLKKDSNTMDNIGYASPTWIKNASVEINNCDIFVLYAGGNSGYLFVDNVDMTINGGKYGYVTTGNSNGKVNNSKITINNSEVEVYQTTNRGIVYNSKSIINNCNVKKLYIGGESTDSAVNGIINNMHLNITGGKFELCNGTNGGILLDNISAKDVISALKISRTCDFEYSEGSASVLGEYIRIK